MEQLLTATDVARILRVHPKTPYLLAREGKLPAVRLAARAVRWRASDVERFVHDHLDAKAGMPA